MVGAKSGVGKTSFMLSSSLFCLQNRRRFAYCTYEIPYPEIMNRWHAQLTGRWSPPPDGDLIEQEWYERANRNLKSGDFVIYDPSGRRRSAYTVDSLVRWIVDQHSRKPLEAAFVDYAQLLRMTTKGKDRRIEMVDISGELNILARQLGIAVVVGSQVTIVDNEFRTKESGSWFEDAGAVVWIKREMGAQKAQLVLGKARYGQPGMVDVTWNPRRACYEDPLHTRDPRDFDPFEDE